MSAKFIEGFGNKLAEQWVATSLTPAFVFWAGVCIAAIQKYGWDNFSQWFTPLKEPLQIASLFVIFFAISISAFIIQRLDRNVIRILEGYWRKIPLLSLFIDIRINCHKKKRDKLDQEFNGLNSSPRSTYQDRAKFVQLDSQLRHYPGEDQDILPTRLGNILRAAECRPLERYGLDAIVVWTRLWILLPDGVRADLQAARSDLNTAARVWLWSVFFCILGVILFFAWNIVWMGPIGLISATFTYYFWLLETATSYCDLIDAVFDLHRITLYKSLCLKFPTNPKQEIESGQKITEYLWRGSDADTPTFEPPT